MVYTKKFRVRFHLANSSDPPPKKNNTPPMQALLHRGCFFLLKVSAGSKVYSTTMLSTTRTSVFSSTFWPIA